VTQSINVVESPHLRGIFMMLREELRNSDIPGRSTMRARIRELLDGHLEQLEQEMKVQLRSLLWW
jgi:hypothetical protein